MPKVTKVSFSFSNRLYRLIWSASYILFFRFSPVPLFKWRVLVLKVFGADASWDSRIYPTARIWSPKNLTIKKNATIGPRAIVYNQGNITIEENAIISQDATLCASSHDYKISSHPLILMPIFIGERAWVCAEAFVGPGVSVGKGCVLGARAVAKKSLFEWGVYDGNPCIKIKDRVLIDE